MKSYKFAWQPLMKESINLSLEYCTTCPSSCSRATAASDLAMLLHSRRSIGIAGGDRKFSTERNLFNFLIITPNKLVNQLKLRMPFMVTGDMFGMFAAVLMKFSS